MPTPDRPGMSANLIAQPHEVGWFWRLMGMYNRQTHPVQQDQDSEPGERMQEQAQAWWQRQFKIQGNRTERYRIFEEMDGNGLITSVLDLYAEEVTQPDYDKQRVIWVESENEKMRQAGEECLRNIMAEDRAAAVARRVCKYGDAMQRMIYQAGKGVLAWQYAPSDKTHRVEDKYGRLVGFRQDGQKYRGNTRQVSWPWDYTHFRLLGKDDDTGYGTALLDALFSPWRQLTLAEDAVLMYRMRRAPDRNLILVDVGTMEEGEAMDYVNQFKKRFRKMEYIDPASPQYRKQYNPMTPMEDIFLPMRGDSNNTRVESLTGAGNSDQIFDLNYFNQKFFGAAKIPKAYMGFEGDINAKATLMQQDIRFARTCKRIQKAQIYGYRQVLDMHYTLLSDRAGSYDFSKEGQQYLVKMSPISYLDEMERLELVQLRASIVEATSALGAALKIDEKVWSTYILLNYAKLPEPIVMRLLGNKSKGGEESPDSVGAQPGMLPGNKPAPYMTESYEGFYQLSNKEKDTISQVIHRSSRIRQIIGDIYENHIDDLAIQQTDQSLLPPSVVGLVLEDDVKEASAAKDLQEDLAVLKSGKPLGTLTEGANSTGTGGVTIKASSAVAHAARAVKNMAEKAQV
jgi:hypothetical protein